MGRRRTLIRALFQPVRATVERRIHASPRPTPLAELADALDLEAALVRYHVGVLSVCGLVAVDDDEQIQVVH